MDAETHEGKNSDKDLGNKPDKNCGSVQHGTSGSSFTDDIFFEILSHLPGPSLSRLKFTCKSWLNFVTTNLLLAKLHLDRGFKSPSCPSIIINDKSNIILLDTALGRKQIVRPAFLCDHITPSCNGLFCIYGSLDFVLFNPTTREELVLPKPTKSSADILQCFLGYVPTTKKYKVLLFLWDESSNMYTCEILIVGTSLWRQIMFLNFDRPKFTRGAVINGLMYCIVRVSENQIYKGLEIMSFDFSSEKFEPVQFPKSISDLDIISELEGRLCVSVHKEPGSMEIWMLEDIRNHAWVQKYTLNLSPIGLVFWTFKPILIHHRKILMQSYKDLHYRDLEKGINVGTSYNTYMNEAQVHFESFVSLKALSCSV